jgi:hypothetical protein
VISARAIVEIVLITGMVVVAVIRMGISTIIAKAGRAGASKGIVTIGGYLLSTKPS